MPRTNDSEVAVADSKLSPYQPHCPASDQNAAQEHGKTIQPVPDHIARGLAMSNAKDNRGKQRKDKSRTEVSEMDSHRFPTEIDNDSRRLIANSGFIVSF